MDDHCVRFNDAYPKVCLRRLHAATGCCCQLAAHRVQQAQAKYHALVVARDPRLDGPQDLRASDLPLLRHMQVPFYYVAQRRQMCTLVYMRW